VNVVLGGPNENEETLQTTLDYINPGYSPG
jgi:hypothetical protein